MTDLCCCPCWRALPHVRFIAELFPKKAKGTETDLPPVNAGKLVKYAQTQPMFLPAIGKDLEERFRKNLKKKKYGFVLIVVQIFTALVKECTARQHDDFSALALFEEHVVNVILAGLADSNYGLKAAAGELCGLFIAGQDALVEQARLDEFLAPLLQLCLTPLEVPAAGAGAGAGAGAAGGSAAGGAGAASAAASSSSSYAAQLASKKAGLRCLTQLVRRSDAQAMEDRVEAITPILLDIIRQELDTALRIEKEAILAAVGLAGTGSGGSAGAVQGTAGSSADASGSLLEVADDCLSTLAREVNPATATFIYSPILRYLDSHLWAPTHFSLHCLRLLDPTSMFHTMAGAGAGGAAAGGAGSGAGAAAGGGALHGPSSAVEAALTATYAAAYACLQTTEGESGTTGSAHAGVTGHHVVTSMTGLSALGGPTPSFPLHASLATPGGLSFSSSSSSSLAVIRDNLLWYAAQQLQRMGHSSSQAAAMLASAGGPAGLPASAMPWSPAGRVDIRGGAGGEAVGEAAGSGGSSNSTERQRLQSLSFSHPSSSLPASMLSPGTQQFAHFYQQSQLSPLHHRTVQSLRGILRVPSAVLLSASAQAASYSTPMLVTCLRHLKMLGERLEQLLQTCKQLQPEEAVEEADLPAEQVLSMASEEKLEALLHVAEGSGEDWLQALLGQKQQGKSSSGGSGGGSFATGSGTTTASPVSSRQYGPIQPFLWLRALTASTSSSSTNGSGSCIFDATAFSSYSEDHYTAGGVTGGAAGAAGGGDVPSSAANKGKKSGWWGLRGRKEGAAGAGLGAGGRARNDPAFLQQQLARAYSSAAGRQQLQLEWDALRINILKSCLPLLRESISGMSSWAQEVLQSALPLLQGTEAAGEGLQMALLAEQCLQQLSQQGGGEGSSESSRSTAQQLALVLQRHQALPPSLHSRTSSDALSSFSLALVRDLCWKMESPAELLRLLSETSEAFFHHVEDHLLLHPRFALLLQKHEEELQKREAALAVVRMGGTALAQATPAAPVGGAGAGMLTAVPSGGSSSSNNSSSKTLLAAGGGGGPGSGRRLSLALSAHSIGNASATSAAAATSAGSISEGHSASPSPAAAAAAGTGVTGGVTPSTAAALLSARRMSTAASDIAHLMHSSKQHQKQASVPSLQTLLEGGGSTSAAAAAADAERTASTATNASIPGASSGAPAAAGAAAGIAGGDTQESSLTAYLLSFPEEELPALAGALGAVHAARRNVLAVLLEVAIRLRCLTSGAAVCSPFNCHGYAAVGKQLQAMASAPSAFYTPAFASSGGTAAAGTAAAAGEETFTSEEEGEKQVWLQQQRANRIVELRKLARAGGIHISAPPSLLNRMELSGELCWRLALPLFETSPGLRGLGQAVLHQLFSLSLPHMQCFDGSLAWRQERAAALLPAEHPLLQGYAVFDHGRGALRGWYAALSSAATAAVDPYYQQRRQQQEQQLQESFPLTAALEMEEGHRAEWRGGAAAPAAASSSHHHLSQKVMGEEEEELQGLPAAYSAVYAQPGWLLDSCLPVSPAAAMDGLLRFSSSLMSRLHSALFASFSEYGQQLQGAAAASSAGGSSGMEALEKSLGLQLRNLSEAEETVAAAGRGGAFHAAEADSAVLLVRDMLRLGGVESVWRAMPLAFSLAAGLAAAAGEKEAGAAADGAGGAAVAGGAASKKGGSESRRSTETSFSTSFPAGAAAATAALPASTAALPPLAPSAAMTAQSQALPQTASQQLHAASAPLERELTRSGVVAGSKKSLRWAIALPAQGTSCLDAALSAASSDSSLQRELFGEGLPAAASRFIAGTLLAIAHAVGSRTFAASLHKALVKAGPLASPSSFLHSMPELALQSLLPPRLYMASGAGGYDGAGSAGSFLAGETLQSMPGYNGSLAVAAGTALSATAAAGSAAGLSLSIPAPLPGPSAVSAATEYLVVHGLPPDVAARAAAGMAFPLGRGASNSSITTRNAAAGGGAAAEEDTQVQVLQFSLPISQLSKQLLRDRLIRQCLRLLSLPIDSHPHHHHHSQQQDLQQRRSSMGGAAAAAEAANASAVASSSRKSVSRKQQQHQQQQQDDQAGGQEGAESGKAAAAGTAVLRASSGLFDEEADEEERGSFVLHEEEHDEDEEESDCDSDDNGSVSSVEEDKRFPKQRLAADDEEERSSVSSERSSTAGASPAVDKRASSGHDAAHSERSSRHSSMANSRGGMPAEGTAGAAAALSTGIAGGAAEECKTEQQQEGGQQKEERRRPSLGHTETLLVRSALAPALILRHRLLPSEVLKGSKPRSIRSRYSHFAESGLLQEAEEMSRRLARTLHQLASAAATAAAAPAAAAPAAEEKNADAPASDAGATAASTAEEGAAMQQTSAGPGADAAATSAAASTPAPAEEKTQDQHQQQQQQSPALLSVRDIQKQLRLRLLELLGPSSFKERPLVDLLRVLFQEMAEALQPLGELDAAISATVTAAEQAAAAAAAAALAGPASAGAGGAGAVGASPGERPASARLSAGAGGGLGASSSTGAGTGASPADTASAGLGPLTEHAEDDEDEQGKHSSLSTAGGAEAAGGAGMTTEQGKLSGEQLASNQANALASGRSAGVEDSFPLSLQHLHSYEGGQTGGLEGPQASASAAPGGAQLSGGRDMLQALSRPVPSVLYSSLGIPSDTHSLRNGYSPASALYLQNASSSALVSSSTSSMPSFPPLSHESSIAMLLQSAEAALAAGRLQGQRSGNAANAYTSAEAAAALAPIPLFTGNW